MASGGARPTAPQNNYAVSATGGSGNSGRQAAQAMTGGQYGENKDMMDLQTSAPLNASPTMPQGPITPSMGRPQMAPPSTPVVPLDAPTDRPNEPVTTGINSGPGAGAEVMYASNSTLDTEDRQRMLTALPTLAILAESPSASNAFRNYVRYLRGVL
jgi:hypothetical protein